MKAILAVLAVVLVIALVAGGWVVGVRNDLVVKKNQVDTQFAQVDVSLQRRADLIPNLVETVKGFASQEKDVIASVANARAALGGAKTPEEKLAANGQIDSALSRLLVVVENYPQLKSNENFLRLQDELAGTENRIAIERRKYNEVVQDYNVAREKFPGNIVAGIFNFERRPPMETPAAKREVPTVKFGK